MLKKTFVLIVAIVLMTVLTENISAEKRVPPFNRIVIILDASGSFKNRRMDALKKAGELIEKISSVKLKRYEGKDEVIIISLDSIPEKIWSGTIEQLKNETPQRLKQLFEARSDYQNCTDVENGFILAAKELHKEPQAANLYLFAFSDLINEPPVESATKCKPAVLPSLPSQDFPWEAFSDVEAHVLWVPINQKQAWFERVNVANLEDSFHVHSESESITVELKAPLKARRIMSEGERREGQVKVKGFFKGIGRVMVYGTLMLVLFVVGGGILTRLLAKRANRVGR